MPSYTELNARLIEEFGKLENLCNQIYNEKHGVTRYIDDMAETSFDRSRVANWERDLKRLKDVRHKRNNLSHGDISFSSPLAEEDDIDFIIGFRNRIISGYDPLTLYRRAGESKSHYYDSQYHTSSQSRSMQGNYQYTAQSTPSYIQDNNHDFDDEQSSETKPFRVISKVVTIIILSLFFIWLIIRTFNII